MSFKNESVAALATFAGLTSALGTFRQTSAGATSQVNEATQAVEGVAKQLAGLMGDRPAPAPEGAAPAEHEGNGKAKGRKAPARA